MKFAAISVCAALAASSAGAFVVPSTRQNIAFTTALNEVKYDSLEAKLFTPEPESKKAPKKEKPVKEKKEKPVKEKKVKAQKVEPVPEPTPAPIVEEPKKKGSKKKSSAKYEAIPETPKKVVAPPPKKESAKFEAPKISLPSLPKPSLPKPSVSSGDKDPNAVPLGIAAGAAPLVLAPFVALGAARSTLSATKARRDAIQKEIEEFEAAEAKRKAKAIASTDGETLAKAVVSRNHHLF